MTPDPVISALKVLNHELDECACVYRLVIGCEVSVPQHEVTRPKLDNDGMPVYEDVPVFDDDGEPVMEQVVIGPAEPAPLPEAEPLEGSEDLPRPDAPSLVQTALMPKTAKELVQETVSMPEQILGHTDVLDYVFDADDPRWFDQDGNRRPHEDVAAEQRQIVKDALEAAAQNATAPEPPSPMPGVGQEL